MQFVEVELDPGESVVAEAGAMMYMGEGIEMQTIFGDGSQKQTKMMDLLVGAGKRLLTGESLFMTIFTHQGSGKSRAAFASPYPGKIIPVNLGMHGGALICQKDAFLCAAKGVSLSIAFQKRIGTALFGGEGFIMQKLEGDGLAFIHAGGTIIERQLGPGEGLRVDTGCLVALETSVHYDIEFVGGVKSAIFGGEGFFFARLRGPGKVWLQSLPFSRLAGRIWQAAPQAGGKDRGRRLDPRQDGRYRRVLRRQLTPFGGRRTASMQRRKGEKVKRGPHTPSNAPFLLFSFSPFLLCSPATRTVHSFRIRFANSSNTRRYGSIEGM